MSKHTCNQPTSLNLHCMGFIDKLRGKWGDVIFATLVKTAAMISSLLLLGVLISLAWNAAPAFKAFGISFLWRNVWDPVTDQYGALAMIYATVATTGIALLIAVPVSFGIAFFLTELAPKWLKNPLGTAIELLAAIPSIVYGMWGLLVLGPFLAQYVQQPLQNCFGEIPILRAFVSGPPVGIGILPAGIILAIMTIPFITAVMRDVFSLVPTMLKESAYGLGATMWEVVSNIVWPYTRAGVMGGIMLGMGRALGETMAVTFIIGNMSQLSSISLFEPASSITSTLANEFTEASSVLHQASLFYLGLILFGITFIVLACSRWMLLILKKKEGK